MDEVSLWEPDKAAYKKGKNNSMVRRLPKGNLYALSWALKLIDSGTSFGRGSDAQTRDFNAPVKSEANAIHCREHHQVAKKKDNRKDKT